MSDVDGEVIWQWRSKRNVKRGEADWQTPAAGENPTNPAYRERWSSEYEFRPLPTPPSTVVPGGGR